MRYQVYGLKPKRLSSTVRPTAYLTYLFQCDRIAKQSYLQVISRNSLTRDDARREPNVAS